MDLDIEQEVIRFFSKLNGASEGQRFVVDGVDGRYGCSVDVLA